MPPVTSGNPPAVVVEGQRGGGPVMLLDALDPLSKIHIEQKNAPILCYSRNNRLLGMNRK